MWILRDEPPGGRHALGTGGSDDVAPGNQARAQAQGIRPAEEPIVNTRLGHVLDLIPGSATDLPPCLEKPQDVYLLVTAGASYTDIQVLANPEVNAPQIAQALSSALTRTPLAGRPVEWSADRYSAAQVSVRHRHFGAMRDSNTIPLAPLLLGLRQAGLTPHLLLRVPRYAQTSLPSPSYGTKTFRWYDARSLGSQSGVTVTAILSPQSLALPFSLILAIPIVGSLGLWLAGFLSSRGQRDVEARRQLFRSVNSYAVAGAVLLLFAGEFALFRSPVMSVLADLWLGDSTTINIFVPFLVAGALILPLFLLLARKQEIRRFGPMPTATGPAIPMSDEEKAARKRVARWSALPHLIGIVVIGVALFAVPRRSPLYPFVHPLATFFPILGSGLVTALLGRQLKRFTQKTPDDDLTWRARQLGQQLGVRMPDVFVEDSSRAAHLAFASHQGHHITLSRKLKETFTRAETDFVLAHHLSAMKRQGRGDRRWMRSLLPLPMLVPAALLLSPRLIPGAPTMTGIILSPWFFPALMLYFGLLLVLMFVLGGNSVQRQAKQNAEADRDALEATGNLTAAESALDKMVADDIPTLTQFPKGSGSNPAQMKELTRAGGVLLRRLELHKTAQALGLASASERSEQVSSTDAPNFTL